MGMKAWLQGDVSKVPIGRKTAATIGSSALVLCGSALRSGGWEGLSHLLTIAYQLGWALLLCHHCLHLYERYFSIGLARATWFEFALLVVWTCGVGVLDLHPDPKLYMLAGIWLLSTGLLFWSATQMEIDREALKEKTGYRAPRATDVIRGSFIWVELDNRLAQAKDDTVDALRERLNGRDTEDGNLSHTSWALWCSTFAISLIAVAGAVGSTVAPEPPDESKGGGNVHHTRPVSEDCSSRYLPVGVPEPQREALALAWHEVHGLETGPMEALGFDIAGCPGRARPIPGLSNSWYVPGYCEGQLRGIALAFDGLEHPVYLLEQAAEFALPMIRNKQLISAEDRFSVGGDGDAYVIDSRDGSFVLVRDDASAGPIRDGDNKTGCGQYTDRDVAYTVAGPGLLGPWQAIASVTPGGVYPIADGTANGDEERFALRSTEAGIVATVHCLPSLLTCEAKIGGTPHRWSGEARTNRAEVKALVEP
ncbi:MAG TPA: hypothetical protein VEP91_02005 [Solirubrobacterales bacterium]|nr:hypothetical protein [Solirubrobacterales bacterium]